MILIIGLGNPGPKFEKTRHNTGFRVVDEFAKENNYPGFEFSKKFKAEISEEKINGEEIMIAKPQTFMNESGQAVKLLTRTYKLEAKNLIIVHDDIDLPIGKIRIIKNRGAAGHKGVESIIKYLGEKNFVRFRIGIQPRSGKPKNVEKFVLQRFNKEEEKILKPAIEKTVEAIEFFLKEGLEKTMSEYNS